MILGLRLRIFFCHRYVSEEMSGRWRRRTVRRVLWDRKNDEEEDERKTRKRTD
jgi:hypothetical protein